MARLKQFGGKKSEVIDFLTDPNGPWYKPLRKGVLGSDLARQDRKAYSSLQSHCRDVEKFRIEHNGQRGSKKLPAGDYALLQAVEPAYSDRTISLSSLRKLKTALKYIDDVKQGRLPKRPVERLRKAVAPISPPAPVDVAPVPPPARPAPAPAPVSIKKADVAPREHPAEASRVNAALKELEKLAAATRQSSSTGTATIIPFPEPVLKAEKPATAVPVAAPSSKPPVATEVPDHDLGVFDYIRKRRMFQHNNEPHFSPSNLWRFNNARWAELTADIQTVKDFSHQNRAQLSLDPDTKRDFLHVVKMELTSATPRMSGRDLSIIEKCWKYATVANMTKMMVIPVNTFDVQSGEATDQLDPVFGEVSGYMAGLSKTMPLSKRIVVGRKLHEIAQRVAHMRRVSNDPAPSQDNPRPDDTLNKAAKEVMSWVVQSANAGKDFNKPPFNLLQLEDAMDAKSFQTYVVGHAQRKRDLQPK